MRREIVCGTGLWKKELAGVGAREECAEVGARRRVCGSVGVGARDRVPAPSVRDQLDHEARDQLLEGSPPQLYSLTLGF